MSKRALGPKLLPEDQAEDDFLVTELLEFMGSTKTSEALSPELAKTLYVERMVHGDTSLKSRIQDVLQEGRSVVITGSAGGGKTMLIEAVLDSMKSTGIPYSVVDDKDASYRTGEVVVVPDLTAIAGDRKKLLGQLIDQSPVLLAANEGLLHDQALPEGMHGVLATLKALLRGADVSDADGMVVVDLAGFPPLPRALEHLLGHPLLHKAVRRYEQDCNDLEECPRLQALRQLQDPEIRKHVADLVASALQSDEVLYRNIWDLLADIFFRGSCLGSVPTSAWFWRLLFGETWISSRINSVLLPAFLSLPKPSAALYNGDWAEVESSIDLGEFFVLPEKPPRDVGLEDRVDLMRWLRAQYFILAKSAGVSVVPEFLGENSMNLDVVVRKSKSQLPVVRSLNSYFMRHRQGEGETTELRLWVEFSVERATLRAASLISLGSIMANNLKISTSRCIAGLGDLDQEGSRLFLTGPDGETLYLNSSLLQALSKGRPVATQDRSSDDADNAIRRFYLALSASSEIVQSDRLDIMDIPDTEPLRIGSWIVDSGKGKMRQVS